jgi:hypothetical protein
MGVGSYALPTDPDFNGVYERVFIPREAATYCLQAADDAKSAILSDAHKHGLGSDADHERREAPVPRETTDPEESLSF